MVNTKIIQLGNLLPAKVKALMVLTAKQKAEQPLAKMKQLLDLELEAVCLLLKLIAEL